MKYLKRINESMSNQDILDCFTDLADAGFNVTIGEGFILIKNNKKKLTFTISDVKETLLFAIPYLNDQGIKLDYIVVFTYAASNKKIYYNFSEFMQWVDYNEFKKSLIINAITIAYTEQ